MAIELGQLENNYWLDDFMVREGYIRKERLYHRIIRCWCGSDALNSLSESLEIFKQYQLCENCGCLLLKNVLTKEGLGELYGIRYFREHQIAIGLPAFLQRYKTDAHDRIPVWIEILKKFCKKGRVLEIGSSHGRFLKELSILGYDIVGLELDPEICDWSQKKTGCDIRSETIDKIKDEDFHVVFSADVLEHVYNPKELVHDVMKVLKPGGKALFQTVIFDNWKQCPIGMLRPLFHTVLYSKRSLKLLENTTSLFLCDMPSLFNCSFAVFMKKSC